MDVKVVKFDELNLTENIPVSWYSCDGILFDCV